MLESLDAEPPLGLPKPFQGLFSTIPDLIAEKRSEADRARLRGMMERVKRTETTALIRWITSASESLILWELHLELDQRGISPCLRWPARDDTLQHDFITWLADMLWFAKRQRAHEPKFRGWRDLQKQLPGSEKWHATAARQFVYVHSRRSPSYWCANGLGLSDDQRQDLMTLPTTVMCAARRMLQPRAFAEIEIALLKHAISHPDRSGQYAPECIANRRSALLRTWVLSGKSPTLTAANWKALTGEQLSRQAVSKQIEIISCVTRA